MELAAKAFDTLQTLGRVEDGDALTRLVYAECLLAVGRPDDAREVIVDAAERLQRQADRIPDPEWRRALLGFPAHARTLALAATLAPGDRPEFGPSRCEG
jgi:hypothetical protein